MLKWQLVEKIAIKSVYLMIAVVLVAFWLLPWQVEAEPPFKIINISASTDKDEYNRTDVIKINYSIFCSGNEADPRDMHLTLNNSFNFSRPLMAFVRPPQGCGNHKKLDKFINQDKTLAIELVDDNHWTKDVLTTVLCNITSTINCPVGSYDLTAQGFVKLNDSSGEYQQRIPKKILIQDNPTIISNFKSDTKSAKRGDIINFTFSLGDKDSKNVNWTLCKNRSIIEETKGGTSNQIGIFKHISLNYNTTKINPGFYVFQIFTQSDDGGSAWSNSWNVTIVGSNIGPNENNACLDQYLLFGVFVLMVLILFFLISCWTEPGVGAIMSLVLSVAIIVIHYILFQMDFILLLVLLLVASISSNYLLSLFGKTPVSNSNIENGDQRFCPSPSTVGKTLFLFNQALNTLYVVLLSLWSSIMIILQRKIVSRPEGSTTQENEEEQKNKRAKKWALGLSTIWMALIMTIIIFLSSKTYMQNKFDFSIIGGILIGTFIANNLYNLRKCAIVYKAIAFVLCIIWITSLVFIIKDIYIKNLSDILSAIYIITPTLLSLIFLPFFIFYYFAAVKHMWRPEMSSNSESK